MYDRFNEKSSVYFDKISFVSSRYEIWKNGKMIDSDNVASQILLKSLSDEIFEENKIFVQINSSVNNLYLIKTVYFDTAYTNGDRILLGTIPLKSNCHHIESYIGFVKFAPYNTREFKKFNQNEPHACSLFLIDGVTMKITFTIALLDILIEFYA